ncbi:MAG: 16S rRNA (adenine(1518)-N(6)/adenine(1519)-N(6))-dimethyltransferase RsmA [Bacteroidia bacterium]|nr:16S rRNA (adenine(1518)-N(6)/adenine(1519)-N(6))-dimethyltransferase RsmA [Bacteroidia bacterium]
MEKVKPKKQLGQHFLRDENIAAKIVQSLIDELKANTIIEVGPGMGVLTKYLLKEHAEKLFVAEIDTESVEYLSREFEQLNGRILNEDFLQLDFSRFDAPVAVIGNFPYNISSQIVFKVIENRAVCPLMVGMFQKEVAQRLAAAPRTKAYGILSVITQAYFDVEYLFTVSEGVFNPPPKVKSAVVRLKRKTEGFLNCDESLFLRVVKAAFNQRRKTLRNALSMYNPDKNEALLASGFMKCRAEELTYMDFAALTHMLT